MSSTATAAHRASGTSSRRHRSALPVLAAVCIVASVYAFSPNFRDAQGLRETPFAGDFLQEWLGGYIVRAGDHARFYDPAYAQQLQHDARLVGASFNEQRYLPIVYPPFYYLLLSPLSLLPMKTAAWVWVLLMTAALAGALWAMRSTAMSAAGALSAKRDSTTAQTTPWKNLAAWAIPAAVLFAPMLENINSSQKGAVCLLILAATFLLLDRGKPFRAGLVFGLLAFKPQLTLVIAFAMLFKRQWRFVLGGAACGAVLVGLSLLVGLDVCGQYYRFATGTADYLQTSGYDLAKSHCLFGFFTLLLGDPYLAKFASLLSAVATIALTALLLRGRLSPGTPRFALQFSGLVAATVLLSPHLLTYDLVVLLLPMFLIGTLLVRGIASQCGIDRSQQRWLTGLLVAFYALAGLSPAIAAATRVQVTTLLLAGLLVVLVMTLWSPQTKNAPVTASDSV